jgi:hypothetical protein
VYQYIPAHNRREGSSCPTVFFFALPLDPCPQRFFWSQIEKQPPLTLLLFLIPMKRQLQTLTLILLFATSFAAIGMH